MNNFKLIILATLSNKFPLIQDYRLETGIVEVTMHNDKQKPVVVIGAGIVGISTAIWLQRKHVPVVLLERLEPGAGSSFGNAGVLAASAVVPVATPSLPRNAPRMLFDANEPLFLRWSSAPALAPWLLSFLSNCAPAKVERISRLVHRLTSDAISEHQALAQGTGAERYVVPSEYWYLYRSKADFAGEAFSWRVRKSCGFEWDEIEGDGIRRLQEGFNPQYGLLIRQTKGHGRISDPGAYVAALARHFTGAGGQLIRGEATDFVVEDGQITKVATGKEAIDCSGVVLTAGIWSTRLGRKLGVHAPMEGLGGYHVDLWEPSVTLRAPTMVPSAKCVISPMENRIRLAGIVELGSVDKEPAKAPVDLLLRGLRTILPGLTWREQTQWMGYRPSFADSLPVLGRAPSCRNAWVAFGHQGVGMTSGARSGRLMASLVSGEKLNIDLRPYSPDPVERSRAQAS